jgi:hypothetical protein
MRIFIILFILVMLVAAGLFAYVYANRQAILDEGIDKVLQNQLPDYVEVDSLKFDLQAEKITIQGFRLRNPKGFKRAYLAEIDSVISDYTQLNEKNILYGIHLKNIKLSGAHIFIERDVLGSVNIENMESVFEAVQHNEAPNLKTKILGIASYLLMPVKGISQLLRIEPVFHVSDGRLFFEDYYVDRKGYRTSVEQINATINLDLKKDFKGIDYLTTQGRGLVNAVPGQTVLWDIAYNPTREKLTMSSTFDIENIDFTHFKPYYNKFSPFIFKKGRASGRLIFNFDNAQIGSDNEILLSGLEIENKQDHSFNKFWPTGADDLYRYFSSEQGDIVFDFKIKGPMDDPKFYLGSKAKRSLTYMFIDKVTDKIFKKDEDSTGASDGSQGREKTDLDRVLDIIKGF